MNENNAQPNQATQPPPPPPHEVNLPSTNQVATHDGKPKKNIPWLKILVFGAVILITLIAFGLIAYLMLGNQNNTQESEELRAKTPATKEQEINNKYESKLIGIELIPPSDWTIKENDEAFNDSLELSQENNNRKILITKDFIGGLTGEDIESYKENEPVNIFGYDVEKFYYTYNSEGNNTVYMLIFIDLEDDGNYQINASWDVDDTGAELEIDHILSTLKFTDANDVSSIDTSSWQSYEGNDFTFSYPEDFEVQNLSNQYNQITNKNTNSVKLDNANDGYYINIFSDSNSNNPSATEILNNYSDRIYDPTDADDPTGRFVYEKINNNLESYNNEKINGVYTVLGFDYNYETIIATNNNKLYIIQYSDNEGEKINKDQQNIVNQILSTLTFTQ